MGYTGCTKGMAKGDGIVLKILYSFCFKNNIIPLNLILYTSYINVSCYFFHSKFISLINHRSNHKRISNISLPYPVSNLSFFQSKHPCQLFHTFYLLIYLYMVPLQISTSEQTIISLLGQQSFQTTQAAAANVPGAPICFPRVRTVSANK